MAQSNAEGESFILFELADGSYGLRSRWVKQMEMIEHITPVPRVPDFVEGVVFVRGQVVPAIDLRVRFGFPKIPYTSRTRLVVVEVASRIVGLIVDTAREFVNIAGERIQPPPEAVAGPDVRYLEGIASLDGRLVLVINPDTILRTEEGAALAQIVSNAAN